MKLLVTINSGSLAGRTYELETGFLTIGRNQTCTIRLDPMAERVASKQHAFIEARYDGYYLTDNQSTNGTYRNGERIQSVKLAPGDNIQFGKDGVTASIRIEAAPAAPSRQEFRQQQVEQFNELAVHEPLRVQDSLNGIGLGRIESRPASSRTSLFVGLGILILTVPVLLTIVVLILFQNVGPEPAIVATVIAFTPALLYILPMLWLDRYDPEPLWLLALAFTWGALVAVVVSYYVNTSFGMAVYSQTGDADLANLASTILSAPVIEESSKGIGLLVLLIFFRRYFDDILDGIVFGGIIALGFATVENVLYYGNGINEAYEYYGWSSAALWSFLILFAIRGMFSPFAHATFTAMTGIGCGIARESHNGFVRLLAPVIGYSIAVVLHMIWNGMTYVAYSLLYEYQLLGVCETIGLAGRDTGACAFFAAYIVLQVPFFFFFTIFVAYIMRRQRRILNDMLAMDIARGLIPEEHARIATSALRGQRWKFAGLFNGKYVARSRYIRSIGKLGLSYWHIQRATAAQGQTASFQQNPLLRDEVLKWREQV